MINSNIRILEARFASACIRCGKQIEIGDKIAWFPGSRRTSHFFCHMKYEEWVVPIEVPMPMKRKEWAEAPVLEQKRSVSKLMLSCYQQKFEIPSGIMSEGRDRNGIIAETWNVWNGQQGYLRRSEINPKITAVHNELTIQVRGIFDVEVISNVHYIIRSLFKKHRKEKMEQKYFPPTQLPGYDEEPTRSVIDKRGIELEGGWGDHHLKYRVHHDGSVRFPEDLHHEVLYRGEIRTTPSKIQDNSWVQEFFGGYPTYVNETCGMHVHFSFPTMGVYAAFVDARFQPWLMQGLEAWINKKALVFGAEITEKERSCFKQRILGHNRYCTLGYYPHDQLNSQRNGATRYCAVNYCFAKHKTMEIRVLPMFASVYVGSAAVLELTRLINLWGDRMCPELRRGVILNETLDTYGQK